LETYANPASPVLDVSADVGRLDSFGRLTSGAAGGLAGPGAGSRAAVPPPAPPDVSGLPISGRSAAALQTSSQDATKTLVDKYRSGTAVGRATGVLPLSVDFPAFGPSVYLVSELTSENQSPTAELNYQQDKKGAAR
jgi:hypothetical protein